MVLGLTRADPSRFADDGGLLYVTYEGFGVVTNSAGDMRNPARELLRAMFLALGIVIVVYVLVSALIVLTLTLPAMEASQGHVLSEAGEHILGRVGFVVIAAAALLATASGVNATMFGDANLAYMVSRSGELPAGLILAAALTAALVLFFPLAAVGQMASLAFLIVYGTVSLGHLRVYRETGAKPWLLVLAVALNLALFALLLGYTIHTGPASTWITLLAVLALSFVFEVGYRRRTGRSLALESTTTAAAS